MICRKFRHNALQGENYQIKLEGMQIINGGQTCKTIERAVHAAQAAHAAQSWIPAKTCRSVQFDAAM